MISRLAHGSHASRTKGGFASLQCLVLMSLALIFAASLLFWAPALRASDYDDDQIAHGFYKTVFGAEIKALSWGVQTNRVKKYANEVKVWIYNRSHLNRMRMVRGFVKALPKTIPGLSLRMARTAKEANFHIYVVDASDYHRTVQEEVFKDSSLQVPGQCLVRVLSRRSGILRSDAVIVADQGLPLFRRCMIEEVLQGLGPVNDDKSLDYSIFNDRSTHDSFTHYDKMILNMLYSPHVRPGMTLRDVRPLTPDLLRYAYSVVGHR